MENQFSPGTRFQWQNTLYQVVDILPDHSLELVDTATGAVRKVKLQELLDALETKDLIWQNGATDEETLAIQNLLDSLPHPSLSELFLMRLPLQPQREGKERIIYVTDSRTGRIVGYWTGAEIIFFDEENASDKGEQRDE